VEVTNSAALTIINKAHLFSLVVGSKSIVHLYNSSTDASDIKTTIKICADGELRQEGRDLSIKSIVLEKNAKIIFTHDDDDYSYTNNLDNNITINDIHTIVENLLSFFTNSDAPSFTPAIIKPLKLYEASKKELKLFLNKAFDIDSYIAKNYFALTGIAKSFTVDLPEEIMAKISSYLKLSDVVIKQQEEDKPTLKIDLSSNDVNHIYSKITGDLVDLHSYESV